MFGKNPVRKQDLDAKELWVQEVFPTLQGEGPYVGEPCVFVRLAGCNLRCWFCDTDFETGTDRLSAPMLMELVAEHHAREVPQSDLIVITGGEPLRQNLFDFIALAGRAGFTVQIETAGTLWVPGLEAFVREKVVDIVCSPKTPQVCKEIEEHCWHYKYIVSAGEPRDSVDGLPLSYTQKPYQGPKVPPGTTLLVPPTVPKLYRPANEAATVWVQPCEEYRERVFTPPDREPDSTKNEANRKLCVELAMRHGYRLSLQVHKLLGLK